MKVVFLGTSSAVPTLKRGLSSVVIIRDEEILLFDCGEGTQLQLLKAKLKSSRIKKIFISHMHGDHVTGLMGLLMSFEMNNRNDPLNIFGPPGLLEYITTCTRLFCTHFSFNMNIKELNSGTCWEDEEYQIQCAPLLHRVFTLGYSLQEKDRTGKFLPEKATKLGINPGPLFGQLQKGKSITLPDGTVVSPEMVTGAKRKGQKIAYCLDTVPCTGARELGAKADLLIYDGTFDATRSEKARTRGHSTALEAAVLAREGQVKRLALTHISPRYTSVKSYLADVKKIFKNTIVARDLMVLEV
ncbi:MAG: ribonuclease Z [Candidatus Tectomicrobia bacterium]|uniref:Ribonuclease Z n=1 Tax=Tectimicrobiota bacterium TaxID=2528274 RepID=A0A933LQS0_UNCTE|nr:ribonuclease Z [Candidatus Tectomicrobia bacterium]